MGYKASDWAMALRLENPQDKLVLLTLAHHVNQTEHVDKCYPSVRTIMWETGMSDKGVRRAVARLVEQGVISVGGNTNRRFYRLIMTKRAPVRQTDVPCETPVAQTEGKAAAPVSQTIAPVSETGNSGLGDRPTEKEQGNNRDGADAPAGGQGGSKTTEPDKRGSRLPEDWQPSPKLIEWAEREEPGIDCRRETLQFKAYWLARPGKSGVMLDWDLTWQRWMRNESKYARRHKSGRAPAKMMDNAPAPDRWEIRVKAYRESGTWFDDWGEPPGSEGCRVPKEVLGRFGRNNALSKIRISEDG